MIFQPLSPPPAADTKEQHGHLVTQILETQKELEDDGHHQSQHSQPKKVEIVSSVMEYCLGLLIAVTACCCSLLSVRRNRTVQLDGSVYCALAWTEHQDVP